MKIKAITISALFDKVWRDHWDTPRFNTSGWAREVFNLYTRHIGPTFGESLLKTVTVSKVRTWHKSLVATPVTANRALEVLSKLLSYAEEQEWLLAEANPTRFMKAFKEKKRRRFATPEELQKLSSILEREAVNKPKAVAFIYILMFSGARPRSIERSTWNELQTITHDNQTFGVLTFNGKSSEATGEEEQVIIPPQALKLLAENRVLPFNSTDTLLGIKMPKDFWRKVRKEAGCDDLWARDLRRTFATVGLSNGVSLGIIGELLNHKSVSTTQRYGKLFQGKRLEATKQIADQISLILKGCAK